MTRMWGLNPTKMCKQHLTGEHREMHMIVGSIRKHPHGVAIVKGHAKKGQLDTSKIQERHDGLVAEMERRGWEHHTPMDYEDELDLGYVDVEKNKKIISERCEKCQIEV